MKGLICELCNSNDLLKQDGVYVCQHCGTKYTVEEAKKMMIEGTVDVQGTVKVDNSAFVKKYLANARRSKEKEDWEETEKYYNLVEQNDPSNIEAIFYSAYGKAKASLVDSDIYKRQAIFNALNKSISIIDDNFDITKEEHQRMIAQISLDLIAMCGSSFVYTTTKKGDGSQSDNRHLTYNLFINANYDFIDSLKNIIKKYPQEDKMRYVYLIKLIATHHEVISDCIILLKQRIPILQESLKYHNEAKSIDPSYIVPDIQKRIDEIQQKIIAQQNDHTLWITICVIFWVIVGILIISSWS